MHRPGFVDEVVDANGAHVLFSVSNAALIVDAVNQHALLIERSKILSKVQERLQTRLSDAADAEGALMERIDLLAVDRISETGWQPIVSQVVADMHRWGASLAAYDSHGYKVLVADWADRLSKLLWPPVSSIPDPRTLKEPQP